MEDDDDIDIYGDLANFGEKTSEDCSESNLELKKKCADLEDKVANLEKELESLRTIKNTLEVNLSSLVKTAKTEIARKDRMIAELRAELENTLFRRGNHQNPKANHQNNDTKNNLNENRNQCYNNSTLNNPTVKVEAAESHINNVELPHIEPLTAVKHDDDEDDKEEDCGGEIFQPNKFASTVYGERLRRKLMEEKEAEKLQKEQTKFFASTSVKIKIIHEPELIPNATHKDNNENQYQESTPSIKIDENLVKKSLKRLNDESSDVHYDKRIKLTNNKNENTPRRDNGNLNDVNISKIHEKINYRLAPIEIRSEILNRKQDEEIVKHRRIDDQRDNYYDKYRKHHSSSRSRSRDNYYSDKRKDSSSRNRESDRRHDFDKSEHYRSNYDDNFQNKYEMRRDLKRRAVKNFSNHSERLIDTRNSISEHHRRHRDNKKTDCRYQSRDDKDLHKIRERSEGRQRIRSDYNHKNDLREPDKKKWNDKVIIQHSSDKSNDSISGTKSETQILPKVKENIVVSNTEMSNLNLLKNHEILNNSVSTPKKNVSNKIVINNKLDEDLTHKILDNNLLNTLSVETSTLETSDHKCPKFIFTSPQEEKIENIEAFIRNFTVHEPSSSGLQTIKKELFNTKIQDICNATINITEALEFDASDINENILPSKHDNASENLNYNDEKPKEHSPTKESSSNIIEVKDNLNNSKAETKVVNNETISINNVSTSYADVLSKYTRKKKKSLSGDNDSVVSEDLKKKIDSKDTKESENEINNESILPATSQSHQDDAIHSSTQNNTVQTSSVLVDKPPIEVTCEKNEVLPKVNSIVDEIRGNAEIKKEVDEIKIVITNPEPSGCTIQLPDTESHINSSDLTCDKNINVTDEGVKKNEELIAKNDTTISQQSNIKEECATLVIATPANDDGESPPDVQQIVEITDEIIDDKEKIKIIKDVEVEPLKCLKISTEEISEQKCEKNSLDNAVNKINDCKRSWPISKINEKTIIVARQKKRLVKLTNSSRSLTVVSSAYSVNRICKSKIKSSVTLSDT